MSDEASADGGGSTLKKWAPLAALVLAAESVVAFAIIWFFFVHNAPEKKEPESLVSKPLVTQSASSEVERTALPYLYASDELKGVTANPAGTNASRFVMFTIKLGLVAHDHGKSPPKDVTETLGTRQEVLDRISTYDSLIRAIAVRTVRMKTVDQLDGERLEQVQEEVKELINKDIMAKLFPIPDPEGKNELEVRVQDVIFSEIIIQ